MNNIFLLILMIFCHIVDDYYLQGWLASAKQKKNGGKTTHLKSYMNMIICGHC